MLSIFLYLWGIAIEMKSATQTPFPSVIFQDVYHSSHQISFENVYIYHTCGKGLNLIVRVTDMYDPFGLGAWALKKSLYYYCVLII